MDLRSISSRCWAEILCIVWVGCIFTVSDSSERYLGSSHCEMVFTSSHLLIVITLVYSGFSKSKPDLLFLLSSHLPNSISYPYLTLHMSFTLCCLKFLLSINSCFWSEFSLPFCIFPLFLIFLESSGQSILNVHLKSSWQQSKL